MPGKRKSSTDETEESNKRLKYTRETLQEAVRLIKGGDISLNEAARTYNIPKSTLHNKTTGKRDIDSRNGPPTILTKEEEMALEVWILGKAKLGFPLSPEDVKDSIYNVLQECPRDNPFTNNRPGNKWMALFLKRHPEIVKKNTEAISKARAAVSKENIKEWFRQLQSCLKKLNCSDILQDPKRIINCDETGCVTCPKSGKVLGPKNFKNLYEINCGTDKESITVLCTYSADGSKLPPMVVYPYKRIPNNIVSTLPNGWSYGRSDSGWMVSATFFEYVAKVMLPWLQEKQVKFPVILFLDGHKSHLSLQLSQFCTNNNIIVYCLPPNATHIMQPCDVSIFRPLKVAWRKTLKNHNNKGIVITKSNFAPIFENAFNAVKEEVIKNGFKACGLFPFNADAVDYSKCMSERRAEIERRSEADLDEGKNQNDTPTMEDYLNAKRVFEFTVGVEKVKKFLSNFNENKSIEDEGKPLFDLWKTWHIKTGNIDSTSPPPTDEPHNVREEESLCTSEILESEQHLMIMPAADDFDIMNLSVEMLHEWDINNTDFNGTTSFENSHDDSNRETNIISVEVIEAVKESDIHNMDGDCNNDEDCHVPSFDNSPDGGNCDKNVICEDVGETVKGCDTMDKDCTKPEDCYVNFLDNGNNHEKKAICEEGCEDIENCDNTKTYSEETDDIDNCDIPNRDSERENVGDTTETSIVAHDSETCSSFAPSSTSNADKLKVAWQKNLQIMPSTTNIATKKNKKNEKKNHASVPWCITLPEWREIQEQKEKEREEIATAKIEKKKMREEKALKNQEEKAKKKEERIKRREEKACKKKPKKQLKILNPNPKLTST